MGIHFLDTVSCVNESPNGFPHKTINFKRNECGPEDLTMERRQVGILLMMWKKDLTMPLRTYELTSHVGWRVV